MMVCVSSTGILPVRDKLEAYPTSDLLFFLGRLGGFAVFLIVR